MAAIKLAGIDIVWYVLTACIGIVIALFPAEQRTRTVMRTKAKAEVLKYESPINWLKASLFSACASILSGLLYAIVNNIDIGIGIISMGNYLLLATLSLFGVALLYLVRVTWFIFEPTSKNNLLTGKILLGISKYGPSGIFLTFVIMIQVFNAIFFYQILQTAISGRLIILGYVYEATIILSFIAMFQIIWTFLFRLSDKFNRKDTCFLLAFFLPWIILIIMGLLVSMNIKPF